MKRPPSADSPASIPGNANLPIGAEKAAIAENGAPRWHSRGYLPHFESSQATQHVTFHLADSLPQTVLLQLAAELKTLPTEKQGAERRKRIEAWADAGHGSCLLQKPAVAKIVQDSLLTFDAQRYHLLAWVVMPNQVHVLFEPIKSWTIAKIVAARKRFAAHQIRAISQSNGDSPSGLVWQREYWDRYIRDQTHLEQAIEYIHQNL